MLSCQKSNVSSTEDHYASSTATALQPANHSQLRTLQTYKSSITCCAVHNGVLWIWSTSDGHTGPVMNVKLYTKCSWRKSGAKTKRITFSLTRGGSINFGAAYMFNLSTINMRLTLFTLPKRWTTQTSFPIFLSHFSVFCQRVVTNMYWNAVWRDNLIGHDEELNDVKQMWGESF